MSSTRRARAGYPSRIVCLTEETAEFLYDLGVDDLIVGVSYYAKRPEAVKKKPKVSSFIKANIEKIEELKPDLVLSFSDLQADISRDLIKKGIPVFNSNQRTIKDILKTLRVTGAMIGYGDEAEKLCDHYQKHLDDIKDQASQLKHRPRVYFEEWPDPIITGISWVAELIDLAGGEYVFNELKDRDIATERVVTSDQIIEKNPEIIMASWCGKKVKFDKVKNRPGYSDIAAVKNNQLHEIDSTIILQPGPACLTDGVDLIYKLIKEYNTQ